MMQLLRTQKERSEELILLKYAFLAVCGFCAGAVISGGLFDFIVMIGAVTRIIGKSHTSKHIRLYENVVILGGVFGCLVSLYDVRINLGAWFGAAFGFFSGIFLGCLAMSLTETLNGIPILNRRFKLSVGIQYIIFALAIGKFAGSIVFFFT